MGLWRNPPNRRNEPEQREADDDRWAQSLEWLGGPCENHPLAAIGEYEMPVLSAVFLAAESIDTADIKTDVFVSARIGSDAAS